MPSAAWAIRAAVDCVGQARPDGTAYGVGVGFGQYQLQGTADGLGRLLGGLDAGSDHSAGDLGNRCGASWA
jgi:hypothetical protein